MVVANPDRVANPDGVGHACDSAAVGRRSRHGKPDSGFPRPGPTAYGGLVEPLRPSRVPTDVRRDAAKLQGTVQRWTSTEELRDRPIEEAAEALRQITTDPIALGVALGRARAFAELDGHETYRRAVAMLRTAGADEDTGARMLAWLKTKRQSAGEYRA
jgi:hypothetical protein